MATDRSLAPSEVEGESGPYLMISKTNRPVVGL
jgi:hypothetical protein